MRGREPRKIVRRGSRTSQLAGNGVVLPDMRCTVGGLHRRAAQTDSHLEYPEHAYTTGIGMTDILRRSIRSWGGRQIRLLRGRIYLYLYLNWS
jgi:hypothetical protein